MKWLFITLLPAFLLSGCHQAATYPELHLPPDTTLFDAPRQVGTLTDPALVEISGLAPSITNPGYFWAEEDSENPNHIQLIKPDGSIAGRYTLPTLTNYDWEDIATRPASGTAPSYVYLAETGDNAAGKIDLMVHQLFDWTAKKTIYRFPEPSLANSKLPVTETITNVETITLALPDGPRDVEAIMVDPSTGDLYMLSKGPACDVYQARYPQSLTEPTMTRHVLSLPMKHVTAAAISPDGTEILIRTYRQLFYYRKEAGRSIPETLQQTPRMIPLAREQQGEAIGWQLDGSGYYSTSELGHQDRQPIYLYPRKTDRNDKSPVPKPGN